MAKAMDKSISDEEKNQLQSMVTELTFTERSFKTNAFRCANCKNIAIDYYLANCDDVFCKKCYYVTFEKECPGCNTIVTEKSEDPEFEKGLHNLKVHCKFKKNGCLDIIPLGLLLAHLKNCKFSNVNLLPKLYKEDPRMQDKVNRSKEVSFSGDQVKGMMESVSFTVETHMQTLEKQISARLEKEFSLKIEKEVSARLEKEISARLQLEARVNRKCGETNGIVEDILHTLASDKWKSEIEGNIIKLQQDKEQANEKIGEVEKIMCMHEWQLGVLKSKFNEWMQQIRKKLEDTENRHLDVAKQLIMNAIISHDKFDNVGEPLLHYAAKCGRLDIVKFLVEDKNLDNDKVDARGDSPLSIAADNGRVNVVKYFVDEKNANFDVVYNNGWSLLHYAASLGKLDVIQFLIDEKNADFDAANSNGFTLLHAAAEKGHIDVVKYLINDKKADMKVILSNHWTVLHCAVLSGNLELVKFLVDERNCDFNAVSIKGHSPLHIAASNCYLDIIKYFVEEKRANFRIPTMNGWSLLHFASYSGQLNMVRYLVNNKDCNSDSVDSEGHTPLHFAASRGHLDIVNYLVSHKKAKSSVINNNGESVLSSAARNGELEVVKFLFRNGASILHRTHHHTVLHQAAASDNANIIAFILKEIKLLQGDFEPYVNAPDNEGDTPLMWACENGRINAMRELLKHKPNLHCQNNEGKTALHWAVMFGDANIVQLLLDHGADVTIKSRNGKSCLNLAIDLLVKTTNDKKSYEEIINTLKCAKNTVSQKHETYMSPLHQAVINDDIVIVKSLVDKKCDMNAFDFYSRTPVKLACEYGRLKIVKYLIEVNHTTIPNNDIRYLLCLSASYGHLEVVKYLITLVDDSFLKYRADDLVQQSLFSKNDGVIKFIEMKCAKV